MTWILMRRLEVGCSGGNIGKEDTDNNTSKPTNEGELQAMTSI